MGDIMNESNLVVEHGPEIVSILIWAMTGLIGVLIALGGVIANFVRSGFAGVKSEIKGIKEEVAQDRKAMLEIIRHHENRLTRIETSCEIHHGRRIDD